MLSTTNIIEQLPRDMHQEIGSQLDISSILMLTTVSTYFRNLFNSERTLALKTLKTLPADVLMSLFPDHILLKRNLSLVMDNEYLRLIMTNEESRKFQEKVKVSDISFFQSCLIKQHSDYSYFNTQNDPFEKIPKKPYYNNLWKNLQAQVIELRETGVKVSLPAGDKILKMEKPFQIKIKGRQYPTRNHYRNAGVNACMLPCYSIALSILLLMFSGTFLANLTNLEKLLNKTFENQEALIDLVRMARTGTETISSFNFMGNMFVGSLLVGLICLIVFSGEEKRFGDNALIKLVENQLLEIENRENNNNPRIGR